MALMAGIDAGVQRLSVEEDLRDMLGSHMTTRTLVCSSTHPIDSGTTFPP